MLMKKTQKTVLLASAALVFTAASGLAISQAQEKSLSGVYCQETTTRDNTLLLSEKPAENAIHFSFSSWNKTNSRHCGVFDADATFDSLKNAWVYTAPAETQSSCEVSIAIDGDNVVVNDNGFCQEYCGANFPIGPQSIPLSSQKDVQGLSVDNWPNLMEKPDLCQ